MLSLFPENIRRFSGNVLPVLLDIMRHVEIAYVSQSIEHQTRRACLEIIAKLPVHESMKTMVEDLGKLMVNVAREDNEENADTAIHIFGELVKMFKTNLEEYTAPFIDYAIRLFENFGETISMSMDILERKSTSPSSLIHHMDVDSMMPPAPAPTQISQVSNGPSSLITQISPGESGADSTSHIPKSLYSFKMITKMTQFLISLHQVHKKLPQQNMPPLYDAVMRVLSYPYDPKTDIDRFREIGFASHAPYDCFNAQIKSFSFMVYLMRLSPAQLKQQSEEIPKHLFRLLSMCPAEAHDSKRDLLQAGRAALNHSETRSAFATHAPIMMDIRNFAGDIPLNQRHIRQISYAFFGDFVSSFRNELTMDQITKAIRVMVEHIYDPHVGAMEQALTTKTLCTISEALLKRTADSEKVKILLQYMMRASVCRLNTTKPKLLKLLEQRKSLLHPSTTTVSAPAVTSTTIPTTMPNVTNTVPTVSKPHVEQSLESSAPTEAGKLGETAPSEENRATLDSINEALREFRALFEIQSHMCSLLFTRYDANGQASPYRFYW